MKYKRFIMPVLILCLILNIPMYAFAEGGTSKQTTIQLVHDGKSVKIGQQLAVQVVARDAMDLYGVQLVVRYDAAKLQVSGAEAKGSYNDFGGIKTNSSEGTILIPLLRQGGAASVSSSGITIAQLSFTAKNTGEAKLSIQELKAVSSETFENDHHLNDLVELDITAGPALAIQIVNPPTTDSWTGGQTQEQGLKELEKKISAGDSEQALAQLTSLLAGGTSNYSAAELDKLQNLANLLKQQLEKNAGTVTSSSTNGIQLDNDALLKALKALGSLTALAQAHQLKLSSEIEVQLQLAQAGASALYVTAEQAKLLEQHKASLVLVTNQGEAKISPKALLQEKQTIIRFQAADVKPGQQMNKQLKALSGLKFELLTAGGTVMTQAAGEIKLTLPFNQASSEAHKLGVYVWNEASSTWDFVRKAKQQDGSFQLVTDVPGTYAVMSYSAHYKDVDHVYKEAQHAIEALSAKHYMFGTGNGKFSPDKEITRAEFISLLVRILGLDTAAVSNHSFADVKAGAWYAAEVSAAKKAGIIQGDGINFNPGGKLTREAMAVMLVNAGLLKADGTGTNKFADDASISDWAKEAVYKAKENGLLKGVGNNLLQPKASAKRADVAVILLRLIEQQ